MVKKATLTPRQHKILWATVRSYIDTAEPVGSKALAENYNLGVSTATIRNILASLEQGGLLFQPHTSSGRVPSDSGYRVYVDELLSQTLSEAHIQRQISHDLGENLDENLDYLLKRAAHILAALSGCIAVVTAPQGRQVAIRHLQLVPVDPQRLMVIVVTDSYQTQSVLVNLATEGESTPAPSLDQEDELQVLNNFLNLKLRGKTFADLHDLSWLHLDQELRLYTQWLRKLLQTLAQKYLKPSATQAYVAGVTEVMRQPEFAQTQHIQALVGLLEDGRSSLWSVLDYPRPEELVVYIGAENPLEPIRHCTLIASAYYRGPTPLGNISLLGPTRMVYERAIASVRATRSHLSKTLQTMD